MQEGHSLYPDLEALAAYCYHNWAKKGSGEYALNGVLQFGAHPRIPLATRLAPETVKDMCVTFLFGGGPDWMDEQVGQGIVTTLNDAGGHGDLFLVGNAGHQLFAEEASKFNEALLEAAEDAQEWRANRLYSVNRENSTLVAIV